MTEYRPSVHQLRRPAHVTNTEHAGHRVDGDHDCFLTNCAGLRYELEQVQALARRLEEENAALHQLVRDQALEDLEPGSDVAFAYPPAVMKGEVGTLPGVPIQGTNDVTNAGAARRPRGVTADGTAGMRRGVDRG